MQGPEYDVAVIGGGLSGSLTVINLLQQATRPLRIALFEKEEHRVGRGVAYANAFDYQPLNVPVESMTLYADHPGHFYDWILSNIPATDLPAGFSTKAFVSRRWFGDYLQHELTRHIAAHPAHSATVVHAEVTDAVETNEGFELCTQSGQHRTRRIVLALGNFPPATIPSDDLNYIYHPHYEPNPWRDGLVESIGRHEKVLFVGSGLTMVDLLINLKESGHHGLAFVLSRSGRLPSLHSPYERHSITWDTTDFHCGLLHLLKTVRSRVQAAQQQGVDWRNVIDGLREHTPAIWQALSLHDKRIFFSRLRAFWDSHRHRIPQLSHDMVQDYFSNGTARLLAGRIRNIAQHHDGFVITHHPKHAAAPFRFFVHRIVNCTGPESNYKNLSQPLVRNLLFNGLVQQDPTALGLHADHHGRLIDAHNRVHERLFSVGPLRKGNEWESTALREIRLQAAHVAALLLQSAAAPVQSGA